MALAATQGTRRRLLPAALSRGLRGLAVRLLGLMLFAIAAGFWASLATWSIADPSLNNATREPPTNALAYPGAILADLGLQSLGLAAIVLVLPLAAWGIHLTTAAVVDRRRLRLLLWPVSIILLAMALASLPQPKAWPLPNGLGGILGDFLIAAAHVAGFLLPVQAVSFVAGLVCLMLGTLGLLFACGTRVGALIALWTPKAVEDRASEWTDSSLGAVLHTLMRVRSTVDRLRKPRRPAMPLLRRREAAEPDEDFEDDEEPGMERDRMGRIEPTFGRMEPTFSPRRPGRDDEDDEMEDAPLDVTEPSYRITRGDAPTQKRAKISAARVPVNPYELPPHKLLQAPPKQSRANTISDDVLQENARALEGVLQDFGVKGDIMNVRPGPVVTLYELEPAPGTKSSRVIGLADDIARSMSAIAARVAVVPGRNAIGIELPNAKRETVMLRELLEAPDFQKSEGGLMLALGKNIGGEPVAVDLGRMPHLLIAGTTGSGKSVGINTMILSLLYRLPPDRCKFIMIDPKMLELSVYDGIPHLLAPVVTDPKKAVVALKWTVREMEERYKRMSKLGVRNVGGYNARLKEASDKGESLIRTVQTGFDKQTGQAIYEQEEMDLEPMPFIVVIVDEMADLMMVAGKEIEGAIQRLAQMARAAGIHLITATQRPSVDVITGTIKANFPTRVSFQVTSKIDSRTILGEGGADQLLGQGDMLYMAGGGRIMRVHGPFVSDDEVEKVVRFLKKQGAPAYLDAITEERDEDGEDGPAISDDPLGEPGDLYDQAVAVVIRDKKVSTSYVQRRLGIGYNRAASLIERMEKEGVISAPNSQGKREILVGGDDAETPY